MRKYIYILLFFALFLLLSIPRLWDVMGQDEASHYYKLVKMLYESGWLSKDLITFSPHGYPLCALLVCKILHSASAVSVRMCGLLLWLATLAIVAWRDRANIALMLLVCFPAVCQSVAIVEIDQAFLPLAILIQVIAFEQLRNKQSFFTFAVIAFAIALWGRLTTPVIICAPLLLASLFTSKQSALRTVAAIFLIAYIVLLFQDYQYVGGLSSEQAFILRSLNLDRHDEINRFSGGRVELFKATLYVIADNLWIGIGRCAWPVDNFYLSLLVQMGMLGCPLFFAIVFYRVFLNLVRLPQQFRNDDIMVFLEIVTVMNFVVAFFEGGGFLGPGQTTMPLWLLAGYFDAGAQISASQSDAAAENAE